MITLGLILSTIALMMGVTGLFLGRMIHTGHPIQESPVVKRETAVIVCLVPRRYDEVA